MWFRMLVSTNGLPIALGNFLSLVGVSEVQISLQVGTASVERTGRSEILFNLDITSEMSFTLENIVRTHDGRTIIERLTLINASHTHIARLRIRGMWYDHILYFSHNMCSYVRGQQNIASYVSRLIWNRLMMHEKHNTPISSLTWTVGTFQSQTDQRPLEYKNKREMKNMFRRIFD